MFIFKTSVVLIPQIISQFLPWRMWRSNFNYFVRTVETELHTISVCGGEIFIEHTYICFPVTDVSILWKHFLASLSTVKINRQKGHFCQKQTISVINGYASSSNPFSCSHRLFILESKDNLYVFYPLDQFWKKGWQRTLKYHIGVLHLHTGSLPEVRVLEEWGGAMQPRKQQCLTSWQQALQHLVLSLNRSFHAIRSPA